MSPKKLHSDFSYTPAYLTLKYERNQIFHPCRDMFDFYRQALLRSRPRVWRSSRSHISGLTLGVIKLSQLAGRRYFSVFSFNSPSLSLLSQRFSTIFASFPEIFASVFSVSFIDCTISSSKASSSSSPSWSFWSLFDSKSWSASDFAESLSESLLVFRPRLGESAGLGVGFCPERFGHGVHRFVH